jgi:hypothetical protein
MDNTFMMLNSSNTLSKSNSTTNVQELINNNYTQLIHSGATFYITNNETSGQISLITKDITNSYHTLYLSSGGERYCSLGDSLCSEA